MQFLLHVQQIVEREYENYSIEFGTDLAELKVSDISTAIELYKTGRRKAAKWIAEAVYCSITGESMPEYQKWGLTL
tara:strand:+ start:1103 stop:1330 length:228 start_codon:yes stop_codon:yes gene_type:complete